MNVFLANEAATEAFGSHLFKILADNCTVFLQGGLGAGKTTLVRGYLRAAGFQRAVKSPTFTLVEEYRIKKCTIFHFDLYRLTDPEELEWIGIQDYFAEDAVCFIEWPEMGRGYLPEPDAIIDLSLDHDGRQVNFQFIDKK